MSKVFVYYKNTLAGELQKTVDGRFIFIYEDDYIHSKNPSISLSLPKESKQFESTDLFPFFDGIIPEGWLLNLASTELRLNPLNDRFELLASLCNDTIGAVNIGEKKNELVNATSQLANEGVVPKKYGKCLICYEDSDDIYHAECMLKVFGRKIHPIIDVNQEILETLAKNQLNQKLALAGVQKKLSLEIKEDGKQARMTVTNLWGRYIFKPKGVAPHLPENEHLCLKMAESFKIQVEKSALIQTQDGELGFIARRFDRGEFNQEYHQEDFCQILEKASFKKYNGSLEQVGKILKKESDYPGDNLYRLYELTLFNFIIGNVDAHLKNISLIYENETGPKKLLSPAYDLISTDLYIKDDNEESALAINGKKNKLKEEDFLALAQSFGINEKVHKRLIKRFREHLPIWDELIEKSFLDRDKKIEFKKLIRHKLSRFEH
ncbi:MAG: HipA domain-containing protein [Candidatus Caldatribacteriota bacterium]